MTLMDQLAPWKTSLAARCFNMIVVVGSYKRMLAATSRSVQAFGQNLDKMWHEQVPTNRVQEYCPHEYEIADTFPQTAHSQLAQSRKRAETSTQQ